METKLDQEEILFARAALRRGVVGTDAMMKAVSGLLEQRGRGNRVRLEEAVKAAGADTSEVEAIRSALRKPRRKPAVKGFALIEEIGRGSIGSVYKARQDSLGRVVALKVLPKALVENSRDVDRFLREARLAASLNHPAVVRVFEVGEMEDKYFISMEFLPGETLAKRVDRLGALKPGPALFAAKSVASALAHAHSKGVVHRDLKPANIMMVADGSVRIVDLGLAMGVAAPPQDRITEIGVVIGTPEYMAPEQARNPSEVDGRADVYSLGATLFFALTGRPPVEGASTIDVLARVFRGETTPFEALRPDLPEAVAAFVEKALSFDPADRFQDADQALAAVEEVIAGLPESERSWHEKVDDTRVGGIECAPVETQAARRLPLALPAAVAVAGAVAGLALLLVFAPRGSASGGDVRSVPSGHGPNVTPIAVQLESKAMELLYDAERHIEDCPEDAAGAGKKLNEIIEKYPGTLAAFRARDRLKRLRSRVNIR